MKCYANFLIARKQEKLMKKNLTRTHAVSALSFAILCLLEEKALLKNVSKMYLTW